MKREKAESISLENGKVFVNSENIALINCVNGYAFVTMHTGAEYKFKYEQIVFIG